MSDDALRFFIQDDANPVVRGIAKPFYELALWMSAVLPPLEARKECLGRLMEAKDAAIRCVSGDSDKSSLEATVDAVRAVKLASAEVVMADAMGVKEVK